MIVNRVFVLVIATLTLCTTCTADGDKPEPTATKAMEKVVSTTYGALRLSVRTPLSAREGENVCVLAAIENQSDHDVLIDASGLVLQRWEHWAPPIMSAAHPPSLRRPKRTIEEDTIRLRPGESFGCRFVLTPLNGAAVGEILAYSASLYYNPRRDNRFGPGAIPGPFNLLVTSEEIAIVAGTEPTTRKDD